MPTGFIGLHAHATEVGYVAVALMFALFCLHSQATRILEVAHSAIACHESFHYDSILPSWYSRVCMQFVIKLKWDALRGNNCELILPQARSCIIIPGLANIGKIILEGTTMVGTRNDA